VKGQEHVRAHGHGISIVRPYDDLQGRVEVGLHLDDVGLRQNAQTWNRLGIGGAGAHDGDRGRARDEAALHEAKNSWIRG
jgi:hypothetical protein